MFRGLTRILLLLAIFALLPFGSRPVLAGEQEPATDEVVPLRFGQVAEEGFGDRDNSGAWSMVWWNDYLYVGTSRSWYCWSQAWFHLQAPTIIPYPPVDPDLNCAADPKDLPLQAEIWRYESRNKVWELLYRSPKSVEIPGHPGRFTSRDIGFRDMAIFTEPDGTEALYVGGTTSYALWPPVPPPRILRSTDGVNFEPIPQDPGTALGDMGRDQTSFRDFEVFNGRLYVLSSAIRGDGLLMEATDPAKGNDSFRWVTDQTMRLFEMAPYNGHLYVGKVDLIEGYSVWKTDASGEPPYRFTQVVPPGAFKRRPSPSVVSMFVFQDRLYVGTDSPTELIRINPDDSWDLIMGSPRNTPDGWLFPLSGLGEGFGWRYTEHLWKMEEHGGQLYIGTLDRTASVAKMIPPMDALLNWHYGYDLYASPDGEYFYPMTIDGFGHKLQVGIRSFASTPHGLFMGTVSYWYGLQIWLGVPDILSYLYFPIIGTGSALESRQYQPQEAPPHTSIQPSVSAGSGLEPPRRLEVEIIDNVVALSWEGQSGASGFRVFRSELVLVPELKEAEDDEDVWIPSPSVEIGETDQWFYLDRTAQMDRQYLYHVAAKSGAAVQSTPSNTVAVPVLKPPATFGALSTTIRERYAGASPRLQAGLRAAERSLAAENVVQALTRLQTLRQELHRNGYPTLESWQTADLDRQFSRLMRRLQLVDAGLLDRSQVE
jgi:hypothetical protein